MTTLPIFGGPLKRVIVQNAYGLLGQSAIEFQLEPEEYAVALNLMDGMLSEWYAAYGIDLGYNFPQSGVGSPEDESGIPPGAQQVIESQLAMRLGPQIGKDLKPTKAMALSWDNLRSSYNCLPVMQLRSTTPRGSGNRWPFRGPYFRPRPDPVSVQSNGFDLTSDGRPVVEDC